MKPVAHHHHTDTALTFHHEHDDRESGLTYLELGPACSAPDCSSITPKKLVRPGYRVTPRVRRVGKL